MKYNTAKLPILKKEETHFHTFFQMLKKLKHGIGAVCEVPLNRLHPSKLIADKYPNMKKNDKLEKLLCIKKEMRMVNKKEQMCYVFCS